MFFRIIIIIMRNATMAANGTALKRTEVGSKIIALSECCSVLRTRIDTNNGEQQQRDSNRDRLREGYMD